MKVYKKSELSEPGLAKLLIRPAIDFSRSFGVAQKIIDRVKNEGDSALSFYAEKFDGINLKEFKVSQKEISAARQNISEEVAEAFIHAKSNIDKFHKAKPTENKVETMEDVKCFAESRPIEKVGLYIPGGSAPLPSTVLMLAIPAMIAGCKQIVLCTPPGKDGKVPDIVLYAADLCGVSEVYKIGGAQAIAAMAYGTETVPKVYKIFGPGNQYVTAAKMLVSIDLLGAAIDMPAGPSEVMVVADKQACADFVAADLLAQAEHGPDSQVVLLSDDKSKIEEVLNELKNQLDELPRKEVAAKSIDNSFALLMDDIDQAIDFSNQYSPEHLILNVAGPEQYVDQVVNAGSVFLGQYSPESAGDYASGTNHSLPTYGYARVYSGVNTASFQKRVTFQKLSRKGAVNISKIVEIMAEQEGLVAHKRAMQIRSKS